MTSTLPGWTSTFPPVAVFGQVGELTSLPDFHAAKRGDYAAAVRVVETLAGAHGWGTIDRLLTARPCRLVAFADPASGNRLPRAFAEAIVTRYRGRLNYLTLQQPPRPPNATGRHRANEGAWDRFTRRPVFIMPAGCERIPAYTMTLLLDDVVTTGGSLSELRRCLSGAGLWPVAAVALVSTPSRAFGDDGTRIVPTAADWAQLRTHIPNVEELLAEHGVYEGNPGHLTESEIRMLVREAKKAARSPTPALTPPSR